MLQSQIVPLSPPMCRKTRRKQQPRLKSISGPVSQEPLHGWLAKQLAASFHDAIDNGAVTRAALESERCYLNSWVLPRSLQPFGWPCSGTDQLKVIRIDGRQP